MEAILRKMKLELVDEILRKVMDIRRNAANNAAVMAVTEAILNKLNMLSKVLSHVEEEVGKLKHIREELERVRLENVHEEKLIEEAEKETHEMLNDDTGEI